uniref:max-interacting protein 1-like isoform X1 n=1 Tax=Myxine glutinosa TaxID=7769 RepID=UPI00358F65A5
MAANIERLIEAAEYLERREREAEHGYASLLPAACDNKRARSGKKTATCRISQKVEDGFGWNMVDRFMHNELEKNRRAQLRTCLERLKAIVPLGTDNSRHTTLGLLNNAKMLIKRLEEQERRSQHMKEQLSREQRFLRRRLEQLEPGVERPRADSLGSTASTHFSTSSTLSFSSDSERDELEVDVESVDLVSSFGIVIGRGESPQSQASDGGYASSGFVWPELC